MDINIDLMPEILLSLVNTELRDFSSSLDELVLKNDLNKDDLLKKLESIGYFYNREENQFKSK